MSPARGERERGKRRVWNVREIVWSARDTLERQFSFVWVRGEVADFRNPYGHWYFALKDDDARLPAVMFRNANSAVPFDVEDGLEVIAGGRLSIYPDRGQFQLVAEILEPVGWGALQLAYEQLKEKLAGEGLFDAERKRLLPLLPSCVGVVTSETGAAWRDICRVWRRRRVGIRAILAPSRVQGEGAAEQIADAIRDLVDHDEAEVLIVGRGGGSAEDLWAFNEEPVARAIAASPIPVVTAVGHEIDVTIADLVADRRAATPTEAAEIVAPARADLVRRIDGAFRRVAEPVRHSVSRARNRLQDRRLYRALQRPGQIVSLYRQRLDDGAARLNAALDDAVERRRRRLGRGARRLVRSDPRRLVPRRRHRLEVAVRRTREALSDRIRVRREGLAGLAGRIDALSPLAVLGRGYAICSRDDDGSIVRRLGDVEAGDLVDVRVARARLSCRVRGGEPVDVPGGDDLESEPSAD